MSATIRRAAKHLNDLPVIALDIPVMFEDEGQEELGESLIHTDTTDIWYYGLKEHLRPQAELEVCSNLNVLYHPVNRRAYVSPDVFVVKPTRKLRKNQRSYRIGVAGPAPLMAGEVLSKRSAQQQDLTNKPEIYAEMGVREYVLVDLTGEFLPEKLLLKRRNGNGNWRDEQDADGGITSRLGFRLIVDTDGRLRVLAAQSGSPYLRPDEAYQGVLRLEAELARLRAEAHQ